MVHANSPSTTDWISALSAAGAAVGTVFTLLVAVFTLPIQVPTHQRPQASHVIFQEESHEETRSFVSHNMSELPITDPKCSIRFYRDIFSRTGSQIVLRPDNMRLAAGGKARVSLPLQDGSGELAANVSFRDSAGLTWRRQWPSGDLQLEEWEPRRIAILF